MDQKLRLVLFALVVLVGGIAMAWNWPRTNRSSQAPMQEAAASGDADAVAPASRAIFPKVLNK